eukprot:CAMPEP_0119156784 /NCGR_PEP_ID=MMETSP1310-20130426/52430_1 /TAXON_ID=464262 /ORGANISM="Genus nov. species nov., Strain RCC2339" /LENGTH=95 /DNA_ID=CAMNT_0007149399 /DNA_START=677 /DNA_END=964 /DNA_ORIENTATION=-
MWTANKGYRVEGRAGGAAEPEGTQGRRVATAGEHGSVTQTPSLNNRSCSEKKPGDASGTNNNSAIPSGTGGEKSAYILAWVEQEMEFQIKNPPDM